MSGSLRNNRKNTICITYYNRKEIFMVYRILGIQFKNKWEERLQEYGWLVFRVGISCLMLMHGFGKLTNFSNIAPNFLNFLGLGSAFSLALVVLSEFFGSLGVLFGFLTRWASFSIVFTMLVAALVAHGADPFSKKELALVYAIAFLFPMLAGGGKYSVDNYIKNRI